MKRLEDQLLWKSWCKNETVRNKQVLIQWLKQKRNMLKAVKDKDSRFKMKYNDKNIYRHLVFAHCVTPHGVIAVICLVSFSVWVCIRL